MEDKLALLLIKVLENITTEENVTFLDKYYQLFDEKKYIGKKFKFIYEDMYAIYSLDLNSLAYGDDVKKQNKIYQELIQSIIKTKTKKDKIKLFPLIVYLDVQNILYAHLISIDFFSEFKDYFIDKVSELRVNINLDNTPENHWERESYERYQIGINELEFNKIYDFIEALERGIWYRFDKYLDFLVFITYRLFFNDLIEILNDRNDTFEIIQFIHSLSSEEILTISKHSNNTLLKFEAIRKAVYFKTNNQTCLNLLKDEQELLQSIILDFSKDNHLWQKFLDFYFAYPLRNPQLFLPLSKVVSLLEYDRVDMLINSVKVDIFISDSKEALNSCFLQIENEEIRKYCLKSLFEIWIDFIDRFNDYISSIILTDIIDIVIVYARDFLDRDIVYQNVKKIIYEIEEIDNRWFKDSSEKNNYFYKQMSKLFVYGFSFEKHKMSELHDCIKNICETNLNLKIETKHDSKTTLQLFDEYILKEMIVK